MLILGEQREIDDIDGCLLAVETYTAGGDFGSQVMEF